MCHVEGGEEEGGTRAESGVGEGGAEEGEVGVYEAGFVDEGVGDVVGDEVGGRTGLGPAFSGEDHRVVVVADVGDEGDEFGVSREDGFVELL